MGERIVRNDKVRGSIPLCSTNYRFSVKHLGAWLYGSVRLRRRGAEKFRIAGIALLGICLALQGVAPWCPRPDLNRHGLAAKGF